MSVQTSLDIWFAALVVLGVAGFLYVWFSKPKKPRNGADAGDGAQPSSRR